MNDRYGLPPKVLAAALAGASSLAGFSGAASATPLPVYPGAASVTVTVTLTPHPPPSPVVSPGVNPCDNGAETDACSTAGI